MSETAPDPNEPWLVALQRLHEDRGRPTLRWLGDRADMSYQSVNDYLRGARKPPLDKLSRLVRAMDGDVVVFEDLWLGARREPPAPTPTDRELLVEILGELRAVRVLMERMVEWDGNGSSEAQ